VEGALLASSVMRVHVASLQPHTTYILRVDSVFAGATNASMYVCTHIGMPLYLCMYV